MTQPVALLKDASMRQGATAAVPAAGDMRVLLDRLAALLTLAAILGYVLVQKLAVPGVLNLATGVNTFFEQYRLHEPIFLALMAAFASAAAVMARRAEPASKPQLGTLAWSPWRLGLIAAGVLVITTLGSQLVMHGFKFSMDEWVADFQARVFAEGKAIVTLPDEWKQFGWSLKPVFVVYDPDANAWLSAYWPIYGILRAGFIKLGADRFLNPLLAAAAIPLVWLCARRLWPDDLGRAWLATGFLALSSQFLIMSMSGYAMPAHLVVNLLWVYAFARNDRAGWIAAPIVGVIALGLHNPFPHALFVTPFLLQLLLMKRWNWTFYFGAVYLTGVVGWWMWAQAVTAASAGGSLVGLFTLPSLTMFAVQHLSLTVILSWQTPLLAILLLWTVFSWRSLTTTEQSLLLGTAMSFGWFFMFPMTQGHGWGYRYTYPVLGNIALLGATGYRLMARSVGDVLMRRLLVASAVLTVAVQIPLRSWQVREYIRPFAQAHEYISTIDADVVIIDPTTSWYGIDLVRNDPFLRNTPKVLSAFYLKPQDKRALAAKYGDRVHLVRPEEVARFGIRTFPSKAKRPVWPPS
jgi:hypothetical protein